MSTIVRWLENHLIACPYKHYLGVECPGCGMQRSIIELLKGNIYESFIEYPPLFPLLLLIGFLIAHLFLKFKRGAIILKYLFIFVATTVVVNYIIKLILNH